MAVQVTSFGISLSLQRVLIQARTLFMRAVQLADSLGRLALARGLRFLPAA
jgi:hypothetical protein